MRDQTRRYAENAFAISVSEFKSWLSYRMAYSVPPFTVTTRRGVLAYLKQTVWLDCDGERINCRLRSEREGQGRETSFSIEIERKACNYGGERFYFLCPHCGRRCMKLYLSGARFVCRQCGGLHYSVESEDQRDRARRRAGKIRERLGWARMGLPEYGDVLARPKWMHYETFKRLIDKHDAAVNTMIRAAYADLARIQERCGIG